MPSHRVRRYAAALAPAGTWLLSTAAAGATPPDRTCDGDVNYFNSLEQRPNSAIAGAAVGNGATFVGTFTSSIDHDACKPPGTAWINGIVLKSLAYPLHPNQAGEQNMANQVLAALR